MRQSGQHGNSGDGDANSVHGQVSPRLHAVLQAVCQRETHGFMGNPSGSNGKNSQVLVETAGWRPRFAKEGPR